LKNRIHAGTASVLRNTLPGSQIDHHCLQLTDNSFLDEEGITDKNTTGASDALSVQLLERK